MELVELTAYAKEKYKMEEMHKWADFPGFSVLCHPRTGQWVALLMRQWDSDSGIFIERCDLKCGMRTAAALHKPYLTSPVRMQGSKWAGVSFGTDTDIEVVLALFDNAVVLGEGKELAGMDGIVPGSYLFGKDKPGSGIDVISSADGTPVSGKPGGASSIAVTSGRNSASNIVSMFRAGSADGTVNTENSFRTGSMRNSSGEYKETLLPTSARLYHKQEAAVPKRIHEMLRLYEYGRESMEARARNFYRQAVFMQDYEDDYPWKGSFDHYYPTYHDMSSRQLRGYFSWRTRVRRGEYGQIPASAACIYIFELLNGIGVQSPFDCLEKMGEFEKAYLQTGLGGQGWFSAKLSKYLRQWMLDYCVVEQIPPENAMDYLPKSEVERNVALTVLKTPENADDGEVYGALCGISGSSLNKSTAFRKDSGRMMHLVAEAWRTAVSKHTESGSDLFSLCFGRRVTRHWYPFSNAVYYWEAKASHRDHIIKSHPIKGQPVNDEFIKGHPIKGQPVNGQLIYELNGCSYRFKNGGWKVSSYESISFDLKRIKSFLHEADSLIRLYFGSGRYLAEKPEGKWAAPYIKAAIEDERRVLEEEARPKITIDMSGLERIRRDAIATRNSLLTEEELRELEEYSERQETVIRKGSEADIRTVANREAVAESVPVENREAVAGGGSVTEIESVINSVSAAGKEANEDSVQEEGRPDREDAAGRLGLTSVYVDILRLLIKGGSPDSLIKEKHLMASIVADTINDRLFDEIGDISVSCEDGRLFLVEEYEEDIARILS